MTEERTRYEYRPKWTRVKAGFEVWLFRIAAVVLLIPAIWILTGMARSPFEYAIAVICAGGAVAFLFYASKIQRR